MNNSKFPMLLLTALILGAPYARAETLDLSGESEEYDHFGNAMASGDFNCDNFDDLAIGVADEDYSNGGVNSGAVNIIYGGTGSGDRLSTSGNKVFTQSDFTPAGPDEYFGAALAAGDFNGDDCDDLAIGIPEDNFRGVRAGGVVVAYGSVNGIQPGSNNQFWDQDSSSISGVAELGDNFGAALAAGDFNNDDYDDLAIGVPYERVDDVYHAGAVNIIYGSASRLTSTGNRVFTASTPGMQGSGPQSEQFGGQLAAGDFDNNLYDDLAIGAPTSSIDAFNLGSGAVRVLYSYSGSGPSTTNNQLWRWGSSALPGRPQFFWYSGANFGIALAVGRFNNDYNDDLAIGAPGYYHGGAVQVLYGSTSRLSTTNALYLDRDVSGVAGTSIDGENFGASLAAGNFNKNFGDDLLVGVPESITDGTSNIGTVHIFYSISSGLSVNNNLILNQGDLGGYGAQYGDLFGSAVACGDFNLDGHDDVVIGVPHETRSNIRFSGVAHVLYSDLQGVSMTGEQVLRQ